MADTPDTRRFVEGSFAPARIPLGFHGNWIPDA